MQFPGNFPAFPTGTKAAPSLKTTIGPDKNPLASRPTITSIGNSKGVRSYVLYKMSDQSFENEWVLGDGKDVQNHDTLHEYQNSLKKERTTKKPS